MDNIHIYLAMMADYNGGLEKPLFQPDPVKEYVSVPERMTPQDDEDLLKQGVIPIIYTRTFEEECRFQASKSHYAPYKRGHHLQTVLKFFLGQHDLPTNFPEGAMTAMFENWDYKHPKTLIMLKSWLRHTKRPDCYRCLFLIARLNGGHTIDLPSDTMYAIRDVFKGMERKFDAWTGRKNFMCYPLFVEIVLARMGVVLHYEIPSVKNKAKKRELTKKIQEWLNDILV